MSQTLHFRTAHQGDIPRLLTLINTAYQALIHEPWAEEVGMPDEPRATVDSLHSDLARTDGRIVVGEQEGQLVVCAWLGEEEDGAGYFGMFAVDPECQGQGLGKKMLNEAVRQHEAEGRHCMRLAVIRPRRELMAWYNRQGFEYTGKSSAFDPGAGHAPVPLDVMEMPLMVERPRQVRHG